MTSRAQAASRVALESNLDDQALAGVLQMITSARRSVRIEVSSMGEVQGEICLVKGVLRDARGSQFQGEAAFFHLVSLRTGRFRMHVIDEEEQESVRASIHRGLDTLLLEAAWRTDDANNLETPDGVSVTRRIDETRDDWFSFDDGRPTKPELSVTEQVQSYLQRATDACSEGDLPLAVGLLEEAHDRWPKERRVTQTLELLKRIGR